MIRTRPRAVPHRVDPRRPRPGRASRGTPPVAPAPPETPTPPVTPGVGAGDGSPCLLVLLAAPVLLLAALARHLISRSASPIRRPRSTVAGRDNSPAGSASLRGGASSRPGSTAAASGTGAADGADSSTIPAVPAHRPDTGETATGRCVTPVLEIR